MSSHSPVGSFADQKWVVDKPVHESEGFAALTGVVGVHKSEGFSESRWRVAVQVQQVRPGRDDRRQAAALAAAEAGVVWVGSTLCAEGPHALILDRRAQGSRRHPVSRANNF